jgi:hypothetical protein
MRNLCKNFVETHDGKCLFGRLKHKWEDNINMDLKQTGFYDVDWIHLAQDRVQ